MCGVGMGSSIHEASKFKNAWLIHMITLAGLVIAIGMSSPLLVNQFAVPANASLAAPFNEFAPVDGEQSSSDDAALPRSPQLRSCPIPLARAFPKNWVRRPQGAKGPGPLCDR